MQAENENGKATILNYCSQFIGYKVAFAKNIAFVGIFALHLSHHALAAVEYRTKSDKKMPPHAEKTHLLYNCQKTFSYMAYLRRVASLMASSNHLCESKEYGVNSVNWSHYKRQEPSTYIIQ